VEEAISVESSSIESSSSCSTVLMIALLGSWASCSRSCGSITSVCNSGEDRGTRVRIEVAIASDVGSRFAGLLIRFDFIVAVVDNQEDTIYI
jgi:hypothetical protein